MSPWPSACQGACSLENWSKSYYSWRSAYLIQGGTTLSNNAIAVEGPTAEPTAESTTESRSSDRLLKRITSSLDSDKAENIVTIDLRGKTEIADYMVIASGRSTRQVSAICDHLVERLKRHLDHTVGVEGREHGDWVLIDAADVVIHVFRPEVREFYQLEKLWMSPPQRNVGG